MPSRQVVPHEAFSFSPPISAKYGGGFGYVLARLRAYAFALRLFRTPRRNSRSNRRSNRRSMKGGISGGDDVDAKARRRVEGVVVTKRIDDSSKRSAGEAVI